MPPRPNVIACRHPSMHSQVNIAILAGEAVAIHENCPGTLPWQSSLEAQRALLLALSPWNSKFPLLLTLALALSWPMSYIFL